MGEYADMLLDGSHDEWTGEYIGEAVGYPRSRDPNHYSNQKRKRSKRNLKHAMKGSSIGGLHLVGKLVDVSHNNKEFVQLKILDYSGKRGKKRYTVKSDELLFKVKFNQLSNINKNENNKTNKTL